MLKLHVLQIFISVTTLLPLTAANWEQLRFPHFSCDKEYDWPQREDEGGENYLHAMCNDIEDVNGGCYETCVLTGLGILQYNERFAEVTEITNQIKNMFKGVSDDIVEDFATRIVKECRDIAKETETLPCGERTKLYDCVNEAARCT